MSGKALPVRVAVRIRPISPKEVQDGCLQSLDVTPGEPQIVLSGTEKAFTYDFVFDAQNSQMEVYDMAAKGMLENLFQGYNVTILAYGQTGSGKTYTMGTTYSQEEGMTAETGVIPRAMCDLFKKIAETKDADYIVKVSFLEIYKEQLYDLLSMEARADTIVEIREDTRGIKVAGLTEVAVSNVTETMACLERGGGSRVTAATAMNLRSSRSHAIFTVNVEQRANDSGQVMTAKLHLVDLAGSERAKKTLATGDRFKEGVNINKGLLSLGNVISALGENKAAKYIPYRDSKLTRMLQESLGGNSHTLMIACTSPADSNLEETVSTLRYADRARKIKNKPVVNREGSEIVRLKQQVRELQLQVVELQNGVPTAATPASPGIPVQRENARLLEENIRLMANLQAAIAANTVQSEKMLLADRAHEQLKTRLEELYQQAGDNIAQAVNEADATMLGNLQSRVLDLQSEQTAYEEELKRLDGIRDVPAAAEGGDGAQEQDSDHVNGELDVDEEEQLKSHERRQVDLNNELLDLNRALAMKENLATEMVNSNVQLTRVRERYERAQRELEEQVSSLTEEKHRLETALQGRADHAGGEASQKKQRVLELEQRIKELRYKMKEQERVVRMKRAADEKVIKLNTEIQSIKQARVKLIRQMREDADKFRHWRQQKDREVMQLRAQDRRRQCQLVKMERLHTKQETVLRRKMENAVAVNRRLMDALDTQRVARERRQGTSTASASATAAVVSQVDQEVELRVSTQLAKRSLQHMIDDRRSIKQQIAETEEGLRREHVPAEEVARLTRAKRDLHAELQGRSAQISDLQHRLMEIDGRSTTTATTASAQRWPGLTSMADAKHALAHVLEQVVAAKTEAADAAELQTQLDELQQALQQQERQQRTLRQQHEEQLNQLNLENEEKVLLLLRHMPAPPRCSTPEPGAEQDPEVSATAALHKRLELQDSEIQRLSVLHETLTERDGQLAQLRSEYQRLSEEATQLRDRLAETEQMKVAPKPARRPKAVTPRADLKDIMTSSEDDADADDEAADPNWRKTPLFRRINRLTARAAEMAQPSGRINMESDSENENTTEGSGAGIKRDSDGAARCSCPNKCVRKCPCRATERHCGAECKCKVARCQNRAGAAAAADQTFVLGAAEQDTKPADSTFVIQPTANKKARRRTLVPNEVPAQKVAGRKKAGPMAAFQEE